MPVLFPRGDVDEISWLDAERLFSLPLDATRPENEVERLLAGVGVPMAVGIGSVKEPVSSHPLSTLCKVAVPSRIHKGVHAIPQGVLDLRTHSGENAVVEQTWMTVKQAAKMLGLSESRVRDLIGRERLPAEKHGRDWAIRRRDVESFARLPEGRAGHPRSLRKRRS
jgi:excisionase family DNA binding protein